MAKTYTFEEPYYTIEVTATTIVSALAVPFCIYHVIRGDLLTPGLLMFFIAAAIYQVWNVLVSAAYPHHVIIDDESISFCWRNRQDRYLLDEITEFRARANVRNGRIFLRVNKPTIFRGRYWMGTQDFTDGQELFKYIDELECKIHPDGLKARARRTGATPAEDPAPREAGQEGGSKAGTVSSKGKKKRGARSREAALGTKGARKKAGEGKAGGPSDPEQEESAKAESDTEE